MKSRIPTVEWPSWLPWYNHGSRARLGFPVKNSVTILLFALAGFASAQTYTYSTFDAPGATATVVAGMNNAGQIVGSYTDSKGTHNFLRSADGSTYTTIDLIGATPGTTTIGAVNNVGQIAGTYTDALTGVTRCYVGSATGSSASLRSMSLVSGPGVGPHGLNDNGEVSGTAFVHATVGNGFLRTPDGTITAIDIDVPFVSATFVGGIDNNGLIVGFYIAEGESFLSHGFIRNPAGGDLRAAFDLQRFPT